MQLKLQLSPKLALKQQLRLTPQLQLAMKMLQMNHLELSDMIKQEVEQNPLLEIPDPTPESDGSNDRAAAAGEAVASPAEQAQAQVATPTTGPGSVDIENAPAPIDPRADFQDAWIRYQMDAQDSNFSDNQVSYRDPEEETDIEDYVSSKQSLSEHLSSQLRLVLESPEERKVGEYLIGLIDRNGYLVYDEASVLSTLGIAKEALEAVVASMQTLDPPGVCARNLTECLLLQYRARPTSDPLVERVIELHLEDLANNKVRQIAQREKVTVEQIMEAAKEIKKLDPKPGLHFDVLDAPQYITPDVHVRMENGELKIELNDDYIPQLRINKFYQTQLRAEKVANPTTIQYIKEKLTAARFIIESIQRRKDTIVNVTRRIFEIQRGFIDEGVRGLKPLTLRDVADHLGLHESTISRVTNSKFAHTPRGVFSLKFFFSSGMVTQSGEEVSSKHIRDVLQEIVAGETPKHPYSDSRLAELLRARGIDIARRTVTKYREEMGIRSSSKRRSFVDAPEPEHDVKDAKTAGVHLAAPGAHAGASATTPPAGAAAAGPDPGGFAAHHETAMREIALAGGPGTCATPHEIGPLAPGDAATANPSASGGGHSGPLDTQGIPAPQAGVANGAAITGVVGATGQAAAASEAGEASEASVAIVGATESQTLSDQAASLDEEDDEADASPAGSGSEPPRH